jgi:hypothetical protein
MSAIVRGREKFADFYPGCDDAIAKDGVEILREKRMAS